MGTTGTSVLLRYFGGNCLTRSDAQNALAGRPMKRRIAAILTALFWGVFVYIGFDLISRTAERKVPGYPSVGQLRYYVYFPAAMLLLSICLAILARKAPKLLFIIIWLLQIVLIPLFILGYTGGM
jgi:hypothetical protein